MSRIFCWLNGIAVGWAGCALMVDKTVSCALILAFNFAFLALMASLNGKTRGAE